MSLRDDCLDADDLSHEDVTVPEWKGRVLRLVELGADERVEYERHLSALGQGVNQARIAAAGVRFCSRDPETGEPVFTADDEVRLSKKSGRVILRLFDRVCAINAIGDKEVTKLAGESGAVPSGASPSA